MPRWPNAVAAASPTAMITIPMCTIMPPLARPTRPRHPARAARTGDWPERLAERHALRTDSTNARPADAAAKAPRPNASSGSIPWMPPMTQATTVRTPSAAGTDRRPRMTSADDLRHGSAGATAIKKSSPSPIGMINRLKYGAPTDTWAPLFNAS